MWSCSVSLWQLNLVKTQSASPELTQVAPHGWGWWKAEESRVTAPLAQGVSPSAALCHFCPVWGGASPALAARRTASCSDFSSCVLSFICYQCVVIKSALKPLPRCF